MLSFKNFIEFDDLLSEAVNTHSTHIEEKFIIDGKRGLAQTVSGLMYIAKSIGIGVPAVSTKMDGIAVFFGYTTKGFFVATKSLFNKTPKINYSPSDIDINHPSGPGPMLKEALKYLVEICPKKKGILYQGDFLFSSSTLKSVKIDGDECYAWHPNVIEYTVSKTSDIGRAVGSAKFGIVVHTKYLWRDELDNKTISAVKFGISKSEFNQSKNVFLIDTISNFASNNVSFSDGEYSAIMSKIRSLNSYPVDYELLSDNGFRSVFLPYINTYVKAGSLPNAKVFADKFVDYLNQRMMSIDAGTKSPKQKETEKRRYSSLSGINPSKIREIMELFLAITEIKLEILEKLNNFTLYKNFVVKTNGDYVATKDEGFVLTKSAAKGVKLVDRLEFSRNNFSKDIITGFDK